MTTAQLENPELENPYDSPSAELFSVEAPEPAKKTPSAVSIVVGIAGAFLLLIGWAASLMTVIDLYSPSSPILSEITGTSFSPTALWLCYGLAVTVTTSGALMFCSREIPAYLYGAFIICPILLIAHVAGTPLRLAKQWAVPASAIYLAIGCCSSAVAGSRMYALYALRDTDDGFGAILFNPLMLIGVAMIAGAVAKLMNIPTGKLMHDRFQTK